MEAVMVYYESISKEIAELSMGDEETEALRARCDKLAKEYDLLAGKLSRARRQLSQQLAREVIAQLQSLAIPGARFEVDFKRLEHPSVDGADVMEFLFSANPGMPLRPLSKVASGGEISRLMLALRTVLARHEKGSSSQRIPILVFDEIDVGIGGVTAEAVGEKMQELAQTFQVFCITHLPQIARRADFHLHVKKDADAKSTFVQVMALEGEARVQELARMMGHESTANLQHARQLLKDAARKKEIKN
jgi:DNA repair protein RecN (Recombination protein N)